jgi:hypothetical protein
MKSGLLLFFALAFAAVAAAPDKPEVQAHLLDQNKYLCGDCFFGVSYYYYCLEADNKVLIGRQKVPVLNFAVDSKNALTKVRKAWKQWPAEGETIPLRYDEKNIWVNRPDGKTVKLTQDYHTDIFLNNNKCRSVVQKKDDYFIGQATK